MGLLNNIRIGQTTPNTAIFTELTSQGNSYVSKALFLGNTQTTYANIFFDSTRNNLLFGTNDISSSNIILNNNASSYLLFGTSGNIGLRLAGTGNLEVSSNSVSGSWSRLFTPADIIAGAGLIKSGANNLTLDVNVDNSTLEISSDIIRVKDSGIITAKLADSNVTTSKLADSSVITIKHL